MNETSVSIISRAKGSVISIYNKGNTVMDKVPLLQKPLYKKCVWGVLSVIALVLIFRIFGCASSQSPYTVLKESYIALLEGDMETFFSHLYIDEETRAGLSKMSDKEIRLVEEKIAQDFVTSVASMSEEMREVMVERLNAMKHVSTEINGDTAEVVLSGKSLDGEDSELKGTLRKVDGEWKFQRID